jgi:hypothetical protein
VVYRLWVYRLGVYRMIKRILLIAVLVAMLLTGCDNTENEQRATGIISGKRLPYDICKINGEIVMPTVVHSGHTATMTYINNDGDIVVVAYQKIQEVYEGDFCRAEAIR